MVAITLQQRPVAQTSLRKQYSLWSISLHLLVLRSFRRYSAPPAAYKEQSLSRPIIPNQGGSRRACALPLKGAALIGSDLTVFESSANFSVGISPLDSLSLVVLFLSAHDGDRDLKF